MADGMSFPNYQDQAAGAIPVYPVQGGVAVGSGNPLAVTTVGGSGGAPYAATPLGYQQITSLGTATGFASVPAGATFCSITTEGNGIRYRDDGTNPTASVGMLVLAGTANWVYSGSLSAIKFIQIASGAILNVSFYK